MNENPRFIRTILRRFAIVTSLALLVGAVPAFGASTNGTPTSPKKGAPNQTAPQGLPMLIDVGADKCIPCKMMAPILEDLTKEYAGILEVKFVDVWKYPDQADKYRVKGIPTQIFYDASGKELGRHLGFINREGIIKGFQELGITIRKPSEKQASQAQ